MMAGGWNVGFDLQNPFASSATYTSYLPAGNGAYGPWTQLTAATPSDMTWGLLSLETPYGAGSSLLDIGVGPAGSEIALISAIAMGNQSTGATTDGYGATVLLPMPIPAGTRFAARLGGVSSNSGVAVQIIGFDDAFGSAPACCSQFDTYGTVIANWRGTAVDPGGTAGTPGAWTQLTAACANDYSGFFLSFDQQGRGGGASNIDVALDVAIGAAGSERIILPSFILANANAQISSVAPPLTPFLPLALPAGVRIAARATADSTLSPDRVIGVSFHGARQ